MKKIHEQDHLKIFAKKLLNRLDIELPNEKQIDYVILILLNIGILPEELLFETMLSAQEFECLYWAINGCNQNQIAEIMKISRETVKGYQTRIKDKYHSKTITQAIYKGIKHHSLKRNYQSTKESLQQIAEGIMLLVNDIK